MAYNNDFDFGGGLETGKKSASPATKKLVSNLQITEKGKKLGEETAIVLNKAQNVARVIVVGLSGAATLAGLHFAGAGILGVTGILLHDLGVVNLISYGVQTLVGGYMLKKCAPTFMKGCNSWTKEKYDRAQEVKTSLDEGIGSFKVGYEEGRRR